MSEISDRGEQTGGPIPQNDTVVTGESTRPNTDDSRPRGRFSGVSRTLRQARRVFLGERTASGDDEKVRLFFRSLARSRRLTDALVGQNKELLEEKATGGDIQASQLLEVFNDQRIKNISTKLIEGEEVDPQDIRDLSANLELAAEAFEKTSISFKANLGDLVDRLTSRVFDPQEGIERQREALVALQKIVSKSDINNEQTQKLININTDTFNASESELSEIKSFIESQDNQFLTQTIQLSQRDLKDTLDDLVLSSSRIEELNERSLDDGMKFRDIAEKIGIGAQAGQAKRGLLSAGLSAVGLGGLDQVLENFGVDPFDLLSGGRGRGKGTGRIGGLLKRIPGVGKIGGLLGGLSLGLPGSLGGFGAGAISGIKGGISSGLGGASGMLTRSPAVAKNLMSGAGGGLSTLLTGAKGVAKVAGKFLLPLQAGLSLFDAFKGFNNAAEIAGLDPSQVPSLGQKTMASISSVLSGLSFGLLDSKDIFKGINSAVGSVFGEDGFISNAGKSISDFAISIFEKFDISKLIDGLLSAIPSFFNIGTNIAGMFGGLFGKDEQESSSLFDSISGFFGSKSPAVQEKKSESSELGRLVSSGSTFKEASNTTTRLIEREISKSKVASPQVQFIPTPSPSADDRKIAIAPRSSIDDSTLSLINLGVTGD